MKIKNPPWRTQTDLQKLLDILSPAKIVGGAVRNAVLGIKINDIDIATELTPDRVMQIASENGFQVIPTGLAHGTVTCVGEHSYEVTTLRVDKITDGRHAVVEFSDSWLGDAERRDFTMNALYSDFEGNVIDFVNGVSDLQNRYLRFIGDPKKRITEDFLRILRFFRFYAHFGKEYDPESLAACLTLAGNLKTISRERCTYEFLKTLDSNNPVAALELMSSEIFACAGLPLPKDNTFDDLAHKKLTLAGKLSLFLGQGELVLSRHMSRMVNKLQKTEDFHDLADYVHWINVAEDEILWDGIILHGKLNISHEDLQIWLENRFPLQGRDILALGVKPGPIVNEILINAMKFFCAQSYPFNKNELLKVVKSDYIDKK